jgi:tetratricopeptide (TPR) repeat protein
MRYMKKYLCPIRRFNELHVISAILLTTLIFLWWAEPISLRADVANLSSCAQTGSARDWVKQAENTNDSYDARKRAYRRALAVCAHDPGLYARLTTLLLEHNDVQSGIDSARRGLEIAPGDPSLTLNLGVGLLAAGHPEQVVPILAKLEPTATSQFYLGMSYRALHNSRAAQRALANALAMGYPDPYIFYVLIEQDRELRDQAAGLKDFQALQERFPNSPWLHLLLGDAYSTKNDDSNAEDEYRQALQLRKNLPIVHFKLGYIAFKRGEYSTAEQYFREETTLNATFGDADLYLGLSLRRLGRVLEAIPYLKEAVVRKPADPLAYDALAAAQLDSNQLKAAEETLRNGAKRFPQDGSFPAQLASVLRRLGRAEEANRESERAELLSRNGNPLKSTARTSDSRSPLGTDGEAISGEPPEH